MHFIKKRKVYMSYADLGLKIPGKTFSNLAADPILTSGSFNKYPCGYYDEQQRKKEPEQYFF